MTDFIIAFKDPIIDNLSVLWRLLTIPFMSLGLVYILGRLIPILKTDLSKNILALISMMVISCITGYSLTKDFEIFYKVWDIAVYTTLSSIIYVTVCWGLYDRIDSLLDKKIGKEHHKAIRKKNKKKISPIKAIKK